MSNADLTPDETQRYTNDSQMLAEVLPPQILPRVLGRFDLVTLYFALIFGSYGAAQMAAGGWGSIPMLLLAVVTFLVPCAMCSYEMGTLYPAEGGIFVWASKTFGPIHGFIAGWLSWVPIFFLIPLGTTTIVAHLQYVSGHTWNLWLQLAVQLLCVIVITAISALKLTSSQAYIKLMFFLSFGTAVCVACFGFFHHPHGTPINSDLLSLNLNSHGNLFSIAVLWLLGVEVPFNMGAEFKRHRSTAGTMYRWGSAALIVGYLLGIIGILFILPLDQIDSTVGVAKAAGAIVPAVGVVLALVIVLAVASQDVAYMNSYSRLLFVSGLENRMPSVFGQVTRRSRVPVPALLLQALGSTVVILTLASQSVLAVAFNIYIAALVTVWCASLFYVYAGVIRARQIHASLYRERKAEIWTIPGGPIGLWMTVLIGALFNALGIYYVFAIPLTSDISPHSWRVWLTVISLLVAALGVLIFKLGERAAQNATVESALAEFANFGDDQKE